MAEKVQRASIGFLRQLGYTAQPLAAQAQYITAVPHWPEISLSMNEYWVHLKCIFKKDTEISKSLQINISIGKT